MKFFIIARLIEGVYKCYLMLSVAGCCQHKLKRYKVFVKVLLHSLAS